MKRLCAVLVVVLVASLSAGCAWRQKRIERQLQHPGAVNCATAEGDLRVLKSEKANVADRIAEGVTSIVPASLVIGILTGTEGTKIRVAIGDYNEALDKRIAQIKQQCGIS